jgi:predicted amidohydrolase
MTARERIEMLLDKGKPVVEIGEFAGYGMYEEQGGCPSGGVVVVIAIQRVGRAKIGMMICFDWRFPELPRALALMGADVLVHPSNLVISNTQDAIRTRCIENRVFIVTANRTGADRRPAGTQAFTGRSQILDPAGQVMVRAGLREACAMAADLDLAEARNKMITRRSHLFDARRPKAYRRLTSTR